MEESGSVEDLSKKTLTRLLQDAIPQRRTVIRKAVIRYAKKMKFMVFLEKMDSVTDEFVRVVKEKNPAEILEVIKTNHKWIKYGYVGPHKETLMHLVCQREDLKYFGSTPFKALVTALVELRCSSDTLDSNQKRPEDYLEKNWQPRAFSEAVNNGTVYEKRRERVEKTLSQPYLYRDERGIGTRVVPGKYKVTNLHLFFNSKKHPEKNCDVPDRWPEQDQKDGQHITLHQRLAISEAFSSSGAINLQELTPREDTSSNNYVVANLGFVVSTLPHVKNGYHGRKFVTIPIEDEVFSVFWKAYKDDHVHSETILYHYLSDPKNLERIIKTLQAILKIMPGFKIYAVVLDMFSKNAMCTPCEAETYQRQSGDNLLRVIEGKLIDSGYVLPKEKRFVPDILTPTVRRLHMVTRVSSANKYPTNRSSAVECFQGGTYEYPCFEEETLWDRDIKKFYNSVTVHDEHPSRYQFRKYEDYKKTLAPDSQLIVSSNTAFLNFYSGAGRGRKQSCTKRPQVLKAPEFKK